MSDMHCAETRFLKSRVFVSGKQCSRIMA
jgi:hypothetical protein